MNYKPLKKIGIHEFLPIKNETERRGGREGGNKMEEEKGESRLQ